MYQRILISCQNARKLDDSERLNKDFLAKRTEYRSLMREHLKIVREAKISESFVSDVEEKLFWKLIKGKLCYSQLGRFMIDGQLNNLPQEITEMWFNHFKISLKRSFEIMSQEVLRVS